MEATTAELYLVDGFPRSQENMDAWEEVMGDTVNLKFVLFLEATDEVCTERCLSRGRSGSGRNDDKAEVMQKRLDTYATQTKRKLR
jgi:UMP-CMP kinase